jgi:hypothetical protein
MTVNMIRMAVGVESLDHFRQLIEARIEHGDNGPFFITTTRFTPRRAEELLDGGSLYWIVKRAVRVRQRFLDIRTVDTEEGGTRCELVLYPTMILIRPRRRRPHQGWRYLKPGDAPPDLARLGDGVAEGDDFPDTLAEDLRTLGLL